LSPETISDLVPHRVADDGSDEADRHEDPDVEVILRGEESGGEEQTIAGKKESDQQSGFGENDAEHPDIADRADQMFKIDSRHQLRLHQYDVRQTMNRRRFNAFGVYGLV